MPTISEKHANAARANGAKSRGPRTPESRERCRQAAIDAAARRAVALSFDCTRLPTESDAVYRSINARELAYWQPATPTARQMVMELIDINWRICRLRFTQNNALLANMESQRQRAAAPALSSDMTARAEEEGSVPGGSQLNLDRRVALLTASRDRLIRGLERLAKRFPARAGSQDSLETEHLPAACSWGVPAGASPLPAGLTYPADPAVLWVTPSAPEPAAPPPGAICDWARRLLAFEPDPFQAELMTSQAPEILVLAARQTGKSTAAAIRAVYEALHFDNATILLAGPTSRQSGQILSKCRTVAGTLGVALGPPPSGCEGFTCPNGSAVVALPDNEATIRGFSAPRLIVVDQAAFASDSLIQALKPMLSVSNGTLLLLTTPNRPSGYFYERWQEAGAASRRIFCPASRCARIDAAVLESMRRTMPAADAKREFDCEFLSGPASSFPPGLFRRSLRADVKPMFEED